MFDSQALLASLTELPGVYRMLDAAGKVLYVGKAKNLKKRVSSYFRENLPSPRIALMVSQIAAVETTVTRTEAEALLLENNLIKRLSPRYNILFRDDKSYPYIVLTRDEFPRLAFHRGGTDRNDDYFGPYPSSAAVRESLALLQKMFRLRTCENATFSNRSRPCLLFQIKRCSGACVGHVSAEAYARDVQMASMFLKGKRQEVIGRLSQAMDDAAAALEFERAALIRDRIQSLRQVQDKQYVERGQDEEADIIAVVEEEGMVCVNLAMVRGGRHLGDKPQFPSNAAGHSSGEILFAFVSQHYARHLPPNRVYLDAGADIAPDLLKSFLPSARFIEPRLMAHKVWMDMARQNARLAIRARQAEASRQEARLDALAAFCGLECPAENEGERLGKTIRIECFDVSHTQGESTVASCVVYQGGMRRSEYRRFHIEGITPGDDYAALRQAISRRYAKLKPRRPPGGAASGRETADYADEAAWPDLVLIDGGAGQLACAFAAAGQLGLSALTMIGVAKGEARKPGLETLIFTNGREPVQLPPEHPALHLIQEIRDEAHRFAISGHRSLRARKRTVSRLDEIDGVGPKRRKALLSHFGGVRNIQDAGIDQLASVPGISQSLARSIYDALH